MATVDLGDWTEKNIGSVDTLSDGQSFTGLDKVQVVQALSPEVGSGGITDDFEDGSELGWEDSSGFSIDTNSEINGTNSLKVASSASSQKLFFRNFFDDDGQTFETQVKIDTQTGDSSDEVKLTLVNGAGALISTLRFLGDGSLEFNGSSTTFSWSAGTVYDVDIVLDFTNEEADLVINGTTIVSDRLFNVAGSGYEPQAAELEIELIENSGTSFNAFFDDQSFTGKPLAENKTGSGAVYFNDVVWYEVDGLSTPEQGFVVTESDESTTRPFEIESIDTEAREAWLWVYGSWDSDGSDQIVVAAGTGDGTNYSGATSGPGANPWGQIGVNSYRVHHFDEDNYPTDDVSDSSGNGRTGTVTGATSSSGDIDGAISGDGVDDAVDVSEIVDLQKQDRTILFWYKTSTTDDNQTIFGNRYDGGNSAIAFIVNSGNAANPTTDFRWSRFDGDVGKMTVDVSNHNDGTYHLIALRQNSSGGHIIYDGEQVASNSKVQTDYAISSEDNFKLLANNNLGTNERFYEGDLDEFRTYNDALSDNEIQAEFDASPKGGQTFFSWNGAESTSVTLTVNAPVTTVNTSTPGVTATGTGTATVQAPETTVLSSTPSPTVTGQGTVTVQAPETTVLSSTPSPTVSGAGTTTVQTQPTTLQTDTPANVLVEQGGIINAPVTEINVSTPNADATGTANTTVEAQPTTLNAETPDTNLTGQGTATIQAEETVLQTDTPATVVDPGTATIQAEETVLQTDTPATDLTGQGTAILQAQPTTLQTNTPSPTVTGEGTVTIQAEQTTLFTDTPNTTVRPGTATIQAPETTITASTPNADTTGQGTATIQAQTTTLNTATPGLDLKTTVTINAPATTLQSTTPQPETTGTGTVTVQGQTTQVNVSTPDNVTFNDLINIKGDTQAFITNKQRFVSMENQTFVQNDKGDELNATLEDEDGPIDLSTANKVELIMQDATGTTVLQEQVSVTDSANGEIEYQWKDGDPIETVGAYRTEFEIFDGSGDTQTVPNNDQASIYVREGSN